MIIGSRGKRPELTLLPVVGSDTAPVREVIRDGHNGRLAGFFEVDKLAELTLEALEPTEQHRRMRTQARQTALGYSHDVGVVGYEAVVFGSNATASRHVA